MKKGFLFIIALVFAFFAFCGFYAKADAEITITMEAGASIRLIGDQGLRFAATASEDFDGATEHGFYLAIGKHTKDEMIAAIAGGTGFVDGKKIVKKDTTGTDKSFAVTIIEMPESYYGTEITAIAYYVKDTANVYSDIASTRNVITVAKAMADGGSENATIQAIAATAKVKVTGADTSISYYADIDSQLVIKEGDTIELAAGTYTNQLTIAANNVTIKGNNFGIAGNGARLAESEFANGITVDANNVTIDGIKMSGTTKMLNSTTNISNLTLRNIYSTATGVLLGGGRTTIIGSDYDINGLTLNGVRISCTGSKGRSGLVVYGTVTNLDVQNCDFSNGATSYSTSEAIRINKIAGSVNIQNNIFTWSTSNFGVFLGYTTNTTTSITYKDNVLTGSASGNTAALALYRLPSGIDVNIVHNTFDYMDASPSYQAIALANSSAANVFIGYNNFGSHVAYNCSNNGSANVTHKQNYYAAAQSVATSDYGVIVSSDDLETKYSKYVTPELAGTIAYELNNGDNEVGAPTSYNLYSQIKLPTPTREDYNFLGWTLDAVSDDYITSMPINQTGNVTLYAQWQEIPGEDFEISANDKEILNSITPNIIVNSSFEPKKYTLVADGLNASYATNYYRYGVNAFTTIADAVAAASTNEVIYVFAGTYAGNITINKTGLTIVGPNYSKKGIDTRNAEAAISGLITLSASNVTLKGLKVTGESHGITWSSAISNLTIENDLLDATSGISVNNDGRNTIIGSDKNISNLIVKGIKLTRTAGSQNDAIAIFGTVTGLTVDNCYFGNGGASYTASEVIRINNISGVVKVENNEMIWSTSNFGVLLGFSSNSCSSMTFCNNILRGTSSANSTSLGYYRLPASCTANIIGNYFDYFDGGTTILISNSSAGATANIKYNYFGNGVNYKWASVTDVTQTYSNNYYAASQTTATSDYGTIANLEALIAAYKASPEYTTYGSICVYED